MRVAILGASDNPERYAFKAFQMLRECGHEALPVSPKLKELAGVPVAASLRELGGAVDTVTMYVGPALSSRLGAELVALRPRRVIFNPGSENPALAAELERAGVHVVEACTLVLLRTNQFETA